MRRVYYPPRGSALLECDIDGPIAIVSTHVTAVAGPDNGRPSIAATPSGRYVLGPHGRRLRVVVLPNDKGHPVEHRVAAWKAGGVISDGETTLDIPGPRPDDLRRACHELVDRWRQRLGKPALPLAVVDPRALALRRRRA